MNLDLPVPSYRTISRRQGPLPLPSLSSSKSQPRHIVIDSTGLRVHRAGEWHVHNQRGGRRRIWHKLHLGVEEQTKEIVAVEVTANHGHGSQVLPRLLPQIPGTVVQVSGDGAYDTKAC